MKNKTVYIMFAISCLVFVAVCVFAQDPTNAVAVTTNAVPVSGVEGYTATGPTGVTKLWELGIAIVAPIIVMGIKYLAPKIPTVLLPLSTPVIGLALGALTNWLTSANLAWVDMAQAGMVAVFIRESWDQALKARNQSQQAKVNTTT